jgi:hypothetical protein
MHRALLLSVALAICLPASTGTAASSWYGDPSYSLAVKKPVVRKKTKRTNVRPARLNCHPATMTAADAIRCGYDYPPWALGNTRASRLPAFRESLFSD